jgi:hypothetical protein
MRWRPLGTPEVGAFCVAPVGNRVPDLDLGMTDGLPNQALDLVPEVS